MIYNEYGSPINIGDQSMILSRWICEERLTVFEHSIVTLIASGDHRISLALGAGNKLPNLCLLGAGVSFF